MRKLLFLITILGASIFVSAQSRQVLKKAMELTMPKTSDEDMSGTRGAGVVWHPVQKKYYASFAGNVEFPMAVFDATGKRLSEEDLTTMADTRGLWYDPMTRKISGNAYDEGGWFTYAVDKGGIPTGSDVIQEGMYQPDAQSQGVYNTATKQIMFLHFSQVYLYNTNASMVDSVEIQWGRKKSDGVNEDQELDDMPEDYNSTAMIYSGVKGQELGFLNISNKEIELYDIKTGFMTKVLSLPDSAPVESIFNFAYANGVYWLFDIHMRKWNGYK